MHVIGIKCLKHSPLRISAVLLFTDNSDFSISGIPEVSFTVAEMSATSVVVVVTETLAEKQLKLIEPQKFVDLVAEVQI